MSKRLLLSIASVAALSALVTGASFALFTANTQNSQNTFTAGTVRYGEDFTFTCGVDASNLAPGDSGTCGAEVTYVGSLDAWIGVDASASGKLFSGATPMAFNLSGGMGDYNGKYLVGKKSDGEKAAVTVNYTFPVDAGNSYQGATGKITLSFHAVQARNNTATDPATGAELGPSSWN